MLLTIRSRLVTGALLMLLATAGGTLGYMFLEGMTFFEGFYMTVITISTVGYGEVVPLSTAGRMFTILLLLSTIGLFAYTLSAVAAFLVDGEYQRVYHLYRIKKILKKMNNHVIVCGYGRNGSKVCEELEVHHVPYLVIDSNPDIFAKLNRSNKHVLQGDATNEEVLRQANIMNARALVATLPSDAENVFIVLTARAINTELEIVSRASREGTVNKLRTAGANHVVMPDKIGGLQMAALVLRPNVREFLEVLTTQTGHSMHVAEFEVEEMTNYRDGISLAELDIHNRTGANIIGIKKQSGEYVINPASGTCLAGHTTLLVLGTTNQIDKLQLLFTAKAN